ncbi:MAG: pyridoxal-phosphate dependent enzyme [Sulfolobales archaeon]
MRVEVTSISRDLRYELRDLIDTIKKILRENTVKCFEIDRLSEEDLKIIKSLELLGCKYIYTCEKDFPERLSLEELGFYEDISPHPYKVFRDVEELLHRNWPTPLVRLRSLSDERRIVWAKLEYYNPFSMSIKDRIGWYMFKKFIEKNPTPHNKTLYEATSTNTGMALAAMANLYNFSATLFLPQTIQRASDTLLEVMGARVERRPETITIEMIDEVDQKAKSLGGVHLNQFFNDANFEVHLRYTAKELDLQIRSGMLRLRGIIAGIGTSGHFSALTLYFKSRYGEHIKTYAVQPAVGETIPGIRRIETGMKWIHMISYDSVIDVRLGEALREAVNIARREGILVGLSSGAVVAAYKRLREENRLEEGDYVLIFPDHGFKYVEQFNKYLSREIV